MTSRRKIIPVFLILPVFVCSCSKKDGLVTDDSRTSSKGKPVEYLIRKGGHYADQTSFQVVDYDTLKFTAVFDSSAVYQTINPENQEDINKLYGFSDNNDNHQEFSARFGWNWTRGALRLYAYVYNDGKRESREITSIDIGAEYTCSIVVAGGQYIFSVKGITVEMPRESKTPEGLGYKLFPYFGGDETAPHDIRIWIQEL